LLVSGPNVTAGYWNRPEATRVAIDEGGWLHTGDAARMDDDGYIWIVDRVKDRYVSSGNVVYPGDVERVLTQHPVVAEAGVMGVRGDGEQVGAAFVVLETPGSVGEVPSSVTFVERLPRNSVGKLLRGDLGHLLDR
jgi:fatty-acyl-CoA synthase